MQREESPTMETGLERITALSRRCEVPSDERSAGKPHATICGSRGRVTAPGDPVLGVKLPGPTRRLLLSIDPTGEEQQEEGERRRQIHRESVPEALPRFKDLLSWAVDWAQFPEARALLRLRRSANDRVIAASAEFSQHDDEDDDNQ